MEWLLSLPQLKIMLPPTQHFYIMEPSATERNEEEAIMTAVDFCLVATLHWDGKLGAKLEELRKRRGFSRKSLSEKTEVMGRKISQAYIQQLESPHLFTGKEKKPQALTVSAEIIQHLCAAMEVDITMLLRSTKIFLPTP